MSTPSMTFRRLAALAALAGAAALGGCANLNTVSSEVATYGTWPGDRVPGTYAFERLPSQEKNIQRQEHLEASASRALETAGFTRADDAAKAEYTVQVGARIERTEPDPWDDPFWASGFYHHPYGPWRGPYGPHWRRWGPGPWWGPYPYPYPYDYPDQFLREIALLIRDSATGKPMYEARAVSVGASEGGDPLIAAMFDAALKEFPQANDQVHTVTAEMSSAPQP